MQTEFISGMTAGQTEQFLATQSPFIANKCAKNVHAMHKVLQM